MHTPGARAHKPPKARKAGFRRLLFGRTRARDPDLYKRLMADYRRYVLANRSNTALELL